MSRRWIRRIRRRTRQRIAAHAARSGTAGAGPRLQICEQDVRTMRGEVADQVIARATKPEQSRTRPAMATARKLLEANSSRMVHHLS